MKGTALTQPTGKSPFDYVEEVFFTFHFETKEDRVMIFRNGLYFMGTRDLYLNRCTPDFDPKLDVPSVVLVWVWLPHFPLHCRGDELVKEIRNAVGKYIDRMEPKENMHACTRICAKFDLGKGLPEAVKIKVDIWIHIQQLDCEKIPFKYKVCHKYGNFANRCLKKEEPEVVEAQETKWEPVKKGRLGTKHLPPQLFPHFLLSLECSPISFI